MVRTVKSRWVVATLAFLWAVGIRLRPVPRPESDAGLGLTMPADEEQLGIQAEAADRHAALQMSNGHRVRANFGSSGPNYTSRVPGEPTGGVDDIHFHPRLPWTASLALALGF